MKYTIAKIKDKTSEKKSKEKAMSLGNFVILTVLTILVFATGYGIIYWVYWDLALLLFPDWSYNQRSIFNFFFLSSLFLILIFITFRYYKKHNISESMVSSELIMPLK